MRILLAALHPPGGQKKIGGVQSWCATVGDELRRRGHHVKYWGPQLGKLGGIFDFGIFANITNTIPAMVLCKQSVVISHGIIDSEKPMSREVAFTSEEVRDHWHGSGPIIRQPIDMNLWKPRAVKKRFLVRFSYRVGLDFIPGIAKSMGLEYVHVRNSTPQQAHEILTQSACTLATGRGAVEAMSCGVPVVICDDRTYQTPLLDPDTLGSMRRNYSGRGGVTPTETLVRHEIEKAIERGNLRVHVKRYHDVRAVTDQLLAMY